MSSPWQPPPATPDNTDESESPGWLTNTTQFFFIPLFIVALCVGLFWFLRWLTYEPRNVKSYLDSLQQTSGPQQAQTAQHLFDYIQQSKRWQGFYDLSTRIGGRIAPTGETDAARAAAKMRENQKTFQAEYPTFTPTVMAAFERLRAQQPRSEDDQRTLRYLAQLMALVGDAAAVPTLTQALEDSDSALVTHAALALAFIGDDSAAPPLARVLREHSDPVNRRTAALALAAFEKPEATAALQAALRDGDAMVRLQAALGLAGRGRADGREQLAQMLNGDYVASLADPTDASGQKLSLTAEQQTQIRIAAIHALAQLGLTKEAEVAKTLDGIIADGREHPRVRDAAIKARGDKQHA